MMSLNYRKEHQLRVRSSFINEPETNISYEITNTPIEDSDQSAPPPEDAIYMVPCDDWLDCSDAQVDLSLH